MYENIAWKNFEKTGSLESFVEYKKMMELREQMKYDKLDKFEGVIYEINKSKGDNN